jgi:hypothetical protein
MIRYDARWFERIMEDAGRGGVTSLLVAQGSPVSVDLPAPGTGGDVLPFAPIIYTVFLLSPLLIVRANLTTQYFYGMRNLLLRRKHQTA